MNTSNNKLDSQKFLKVPDINITADLVYSQPCGKSSTSINSKGSNTTLRDNLPNFRVPWKIVLLGDAGVGKSSLVKKFLNGVFNSIYNPTVEDSYLHNINLPERPSQCVEIVDTSGFYQFPAMRELNIKLATAFILVFDLSKSESFESLIEFRKIINNIKGTENVPLILVGNKLDLISENSLVSKKAKSIADETFKCVFIESSAKENINISKIFETIVELILKEIDELKQLKDSLNASNNVSRRNSSMSFVRRLSDNASNKRDMSRRYSEPAVVEKNDNDVIKNKQNCGKESEKTSTPISKRKQKNCIIS